MQSRYYNPDWGRFVNADNDGGEVGSLLSHNAFAYTMNNPVNMSDPDGNKGIFNDLIQSAKSVVSNIVNTIIKHPIATAITAFMTIAAVVGTNYIINHPKSATGIVTGTTAITNTVSKALETPIVKETEEKIENSAENLSSKIINGLKSSTNIITKTNSNGKIVPYAKQFQISEDYKIILRRDIGEFAHTFDDHYNLELQTKAGNVKYNLHLFVNDAMEIIKRQD